MHFSTSSIRTSPGGFTAGLFNSYFSKPADVVNTQGELAPEDQRELVNPVPQAFNILTLNVQVAINEYLHLKGFPRISLNGYANNLLNEKIYIPEFSRKTINSIPAMGGRAIYGGVTVRF